MEVKELNEKYKRLQNWEEEYRKELISYINEAFAMHGNEFVYKCDTHDSWKEKSEDEEDDFDAMNDLPVNLTVWVDDDGGHEMYPYCIRQVCTDSGYKSIEMDGYDWYGTDWVEDVDVHEGVENLVAIADFINAVLEQEQEILNE